mgnify:CR=1 FL=1
MEVKINKLNKSFIIEDGSRQRVILSRIGFSASILAGFLPVYEVLFEGQAIDALSLLNALLLFVAALFFFFIHRNFSNAEEIPLRDIKALVLENGAVPVYVLKLENGKTRNFHKLKSASKINQLKAVLQDAGIPIIKQDREL